MSARIIRSLLISSNRLAARLDRRRAPGARGARAYGGSPPPGKPPSRGTAPGGKAGALADQAPSGGASVSRPHVELIASRGEIGLAHLGSHNGTLVNGERIEGSRTLGFWRATPDSLASPPSSGEGSISTRRAMSGSWASFSTSS
ncbi:FHA domain-containing protein [Sorangium sp. So ce1000]|uniref:FHA domain-containing protein n=1 Tax=Sorangium sp. So ce1000 TaxID=3133325 RepID=UPI003F5E67C9